jgi:tetratricopeptide (TPR) repeat protein
MRELVNRLTNPESNEFSVLPSAIFGSATTLSAQILPTKPRWRVGLWPIISQSNSESAMGVAAVLGYLLDGWRDVRVYRVFAQLDGDPDSYTWNIQKSQFGVDDWQVDDLDENVAVWGSMAQEGQTWQLRLEIENDLSGEEAPVVFDYQAASIADLVNLLPQAAQDIASNLGADEKFLSAPVYSTVSGDEGQLKEFLGDLFAWERDLLLFLWGNSWSKEQVNSISQSLIEDSANLEGDFGGWAVANAISRSMFPAFNPVGEWLISTVDDVVNAFESDGLVPVTLARGMYRLGYSQETYDLLETTVSNYPESRLGWLALAEFYRAGGHISQAIDTFQRAIEIDAVDEALFMAYADLLLVLDYENWTLEEFILIDPAEKRSDLLIWEAIEAYQAVLDINPDRQDALYQQVMQLVELGEDEPRLWSGFQRLVDNDPTGEQVKTFVDSLYHLDNSARAIQILQNAISRQPDRYDLYLNQAVAYIANEQMSQAEANLQKARQFTSDPAALSMIDRLSLSIADPEFEARLGDLTVLVNAGKSLNAADVDFLEAAVEKVPTFGDGYVLLAKAYLAWEEPASALETLLDGQKQLPEDVNIIEMLARVLWISDEKALAFETLRKALEKYPAQVSFLALLGRYLFDENQDEEARAYLAKAEVIDPRNSVLNEVRIYIARNINN